MASGVLYAVDPLVLEYCGDAIAASSPRARKRLRVAPHIASLLTSARDGITAGDADPVAVRALIAAGFLVRQQRPDEPVAPWNDWGTTAWNFHVRTRDTTFVASSSPPEMIASYLARIRARPMPLSTRPAVDDRILLLPRVRMPMEVPYRAVLEGRRTHRDFEDLELDLDRFSDMLHYCFAPLRFADAGPMGVMQLRASASGGARHETEAFVAVWNVANVEPGLYHYDNIRHGLVPLSAAASRTDLEHIIFDQGFFLHSAFGVLTVGVADRMSWKYPHPRAYKLLLQNVGHVAQVFSMTATALGLGAAITGAIRDSVADELLGLDQPREFTTFALACGFPVRRTDGLPLSIRPPAHAQERY